jgi:hypothetical protein
MIKKISVILLLLNAALSNAQTIKTDVLVIGGGASGVAAAVQSAYSKVKTILAANNIGIGADNKRNDMITVDANRNIPSGLWGDFRKRVRDFYKTIKGYDTAYNAPLRFEPAVADTVLKQMTDTLKNLTVYLNAPFTSIEKDGDRWEVAIKQNGKTIYIKARVVIDATENGQVVAKTGAKLPVSLEKLNVDSQPLLYRTSIAAMRGHKTTDSPKPLDKPDIADYVPINALVVKDADNLICTEMVLPNYKGINYLPFKLEIGQGAGTIAAFCAFFKTTTKNLNVRAIQGELLDFKGYILPFADVNQNDPAWRATQQIGATGLLKGGQLIGEDDAQFVFMPDATVNTVEIKPILTEIYTRAFLWFNKEKPGEKFTVGNTLSLISDYTLTEPALVNKTIQKAWKTQYKFKVDFDLNRPVTRREFAVLVNKYLNPFARTVDLRGRLVN